MQGSTKIAAASLAMLVLGSSASIAQPYGNRGSRPSSGQDYARCYEQPFGPADCAQLRQTPAFEQFRERNAATLPGFIMDPATNTPVTFQQYQARYPRSDRGAWQYDAVRNVWVDTAPQQGQAQNQGDQGYRDRDPEREQARDRNRDRERQRAYERDREQNYAHDREREDN